MGLAGFESGFSTLAGTVAPKVLMSKSPTEGRGLSCQEGHTYSYKPYNDSTLININKG